MRLFGQRASTYHGWHLARYDRLAGRYAHLLHQCILECQMIASVYQQLILQMLWWMKVFARRFVTITTSLEKAKNNFYSSCL